MFRVSCIVLFFTVLNLMIGIVNEIPPDHAEEFEFVVNQDGYIRAEAVSENLNITEESYSVYKNGLIKQQLRQVFTLFVIYLFSLIGAFFVTYVMYVPLHMVVKGNRSIATPTIVGMICALMIIFLTNYFAREIAYAIGAEYPNPKIWF